MSLSVIIPCYNVEPYLVQCLDSVLVDNAFLGEVICVDDGSTDSTAAILHRYAGRYVNLQVITQPNAGLSAARNKGLKYATGDYIYFLDSDDYLYPHILQSMLTLAQTNNLDVVAMSSLKDGVEPYFSADLYIDGVVSGIEFARQFYEHCGYSYPAPVWMYIYRRKFLLDNQLAFLEGFLHEDEDFTPRVLTFCQRLMLTNQPVQYHRVKREGAITSTTSVKHLNDLSIIQRQLYCSILQKYSELWGGVLADAISEQYLHILLCATNNRIKLRECIAREDFRIWKRCTNDAYVKKIISLARLSQRLATGYYYNTLSPLFRKIINRLL